MTADGAAHRFGARVNCPTPPAGTIYSARPAAKESRCDELGIWESTSTLSHLLLQAADAHPDRPAVWSSTGELTYAGLYDRSMCLARALVEHGIEPGDRVVIALAKDVALPVAIFGTLLAGGAYVPIDYLTPPARARTPSPPTPRRSPWSPARGRRPVRGPGQAALTL